MPKGARHEESGILRPGIWGYSLEMAGGGVWELDVSGSADRYLGKRVTVVGTRADFNLLDVGRGGIRLYGAPPVPKRRSLLRRLFARDTDS